MVPPVTQPGNSKDGKYIDSLAKRGGIFDLFVRLEDGNNFVRLESATGSAELGCQALKKYVSSYRVHVAEDQGSTHSFCASLK